MGRLGLMRMFAATGTRQDEEELRAATRMEKDRTVACAQLRAQMRRNQIIVKQNLADTRHLHERIIAEEEQLEKSLESSEETLQEFAEFKRVVEGDIKLQKQKPQWQEAMKNFMTLAEGKDASTNSDNASTLTLSRLLCDHLAMAEGRGEAASYPAAVLTYHPSASINDMIKVMHATGEVGFRTGQTLNAHAARSTPLAQAVWQVIRSGKPILTNPHGTVVDSFSIMPLVSKSGTPFGCVVSGPAAAPDELIDTFARTAGQMFERIGKLETVWRVLGHVEEFIKQQCRVERRLVYVNFVNDAVPQTSDSAWAWQPLKYICAANDKRFELPLVWSCGDVG